jgi:hypothetical protein
MDDGWMTSMLARGYSKGPAFQSYDEMSVWDKTNTRPHARRMLFIEVSFVK